MHINQIWTIAATLTFAAGLANAQSSIEAINSSFDGNALRLDSISVTRAGVEQLIGFGAMNNIEVTSYAGSTLPFENTLLSTPLNADGTPNAPAVGERSAVLSDAFINSAIQNPNGVDGLVFGFADGPLTNGPGADLILFDIGAAPGAPVPGPDGPGTLISPGGDPFRLAGVGADASLSASFTSDMYFQIGADNLFSGNTGFFNNLDTFPTSTLDELNTVDLNAIPLPPTFPLTAYAILIDLSDLGFAEGDTVAELNLLKSGDTFGIDPGLIAGLPAVPAPAGGGLLSFAGMLLARRRR